VLDRRISGQDSDREVLADILYPTALADRSEPERDRFIEAFGGYFSRVLDPFGIADGDAAGTDCHRRSVADSALYSLPGRSARMKRNRSARVEK